MVSVIIPCYNQGRFLSKAIDSVLKQTYKHYEIIVVDDGSEDDTKCIAARYPEVEYVFQKNQGLAAARNTGISHSSGNLLVFLDSDDWLIPEALEINVAYILSHPEMAFVSGSYKLYYEYENKVREVVREVKDDSYIHMLEGNYVGMIAAVMFRKWVFNSFQYDTSLKVCEDYDLFLKISRKYPAIQHDKIIAVYRIHDKNLSGNHIKMLDTVLAVLEKQKKIVSGKKEISALKTGHSSWKFYYCLLMYEDLLHQLFNGKKINVSYVHTLLRKNKKLYLKFQQKRSFHLMRNQLKKILPDIIVKRLVKSATPALGKVNLGDLNVTEPFSTEFAYDRGGPVDRYYIENFLEKQKTRVTGRVLEIGDNEYTQRYGGSRVVKSDILHVDNTNPYATIIGDLADAPQIPANIFDCIVLTQTLHLIYNYRGAIETCHRILKPGGILLLTVPGISHVGQDQWGKYWQWSFTNNSISRILNEFFPSHNVNIETFGNVLIATAFLYGLGLPEVTKKQLDAFDPHYQVIIAASAVK
jgi:glycosyltransferase involved in cell wall biosynthesis/SAM-dependent methyltransferase